MYIREITLDHFQQLSTATKLQNWELLSDKGMRVVLNSYGPTLLALELPDKKKILQNIVLHYDNIISYEKDTSIGRIAIGQYADLITDAKYTLPNGTVIQLEPNSGRHMLHGGAHGWAMQVWEVSKTEKLTDSVSIIFHLHIPDKSPDQNGFPGTIDAYVKVILTNQNSLVFEYTATSDSTTPIKITNHSYFNLNGTAQSTAIDNHMLQTNADRFVVIDKAGLPTGEIKNITGTPFDFRDKKRIGENFTAKTFDHCLLFPKDTQGKAILYSPLTHIMMKLTTDQPAIQLYNSANLTSPFYPYTAMCVEPQQPIDYINHPGWYGQFGKPFTEKDSIYRNKIIYTFSVEK